MRRSLVLLKNGANADEPVLPLPKKATNILVAGAHANNMGYQCGGWTITWQGLSGNTTTGTFPIPQRCSDFSKMSICACLILQKSCIF